MLTKLSSIDKSVPIPLYFQLKQLILSEIQNGTYKSGDIIPTENEISDAFKISRTTVRQAVTELVQEGWLYRVKSKGTFVSLPKINQDFIKKLESFNDQILRSGMEPSTEVLEFKVIPATDDVAKHLEVKENESVIYLHRKRLADGEPIVTIKTYLPYSVCSFVMDHDLKQERLYGILSESPATTVFRVERIVEAVEATSEDATLLKIKKGKPIQYFASTGYNTFGKPIEYSLARYRGDRSTFEITVFPENK
ncbi:MAG: GntR family transcriptional regulator [Bacillota bacterium]|jgi:GntR family transcriptional regulator|nr:GntR family transcriptional regulator [Bacillota bacterium]